MRWRLAWLREYREDIYEIGSVLVLVVILIVLATLLGQWSLP